MIRISILATLVAGCLPLPPEHTYDDERHVAVSYSLLGPADAPASCPADGRAIQARACIDDIQSGCFTQDAPCAGSGTIDLAVYTSGTFYPEDTVSFDLVPVMFVDVSLIDDADERRTETIPERLDLTAGDGQLAATLYPEAGFLRLGWVLTSGMTGNTVTSCSVVGIDEIELVYGEDTGVTPVLDQHVRWPCAHRSSTEDPEDSTVGDGDTPALAPGSYAAEVVGYRAGVEVARATDQSFFVSDNGELTEQNVYVDVADR